MTSPDPGSAHPRVAVPKAIGWSIAFLLLATVLAVLLGTGAGLLVTGSWDGLREWLTQGAASALTIQAGATLVAGLAATWAIGIKGLGMTLGDLRYRHVGAGGRGFAVGLAVGALAAGTALAVAAASGAARWVEDAGTVAGYVAQVGKTVLVLAPAAFSEEVLFRGVPLVVLAAALGRGAALLLVSLLFAVAHIVNPNVSAIGLANIAIAGIFLGLAFYAPGGIWTAFGAHLGWNATLAALDAPVSGLPFRIPLLDYHAGAPIWLTGGAFGPEGGLAATVALAAGSFAMARRIRKESP